MTIEQITAEFSQVTRDLTALEYEIDRRRQVKIKDMRKQASAMRRRLKDLRVAYAEAGLSAIEAAQRTAEQGD